MCGRVGGPGYVTILNLGYNTFTVIKVWYNHLSNIFSTRQNKHSLHTLKKKWKQGTGFSSTSILHASQIWKVNQSTYLNLRSLMPRNGQMLNNICFSTFAIQIKPLLSTFPGAFLSFFMVYWVNTWQGTTGF